MAEDATGTKDRLSSSFRRRARHAPTLRPHSQGIASSKRLGSAALIRGLSGPRGLAIRCLTLKEAKAASSPGAGLVCVKFVSCKAFRGELEGRTAMAPKKKTKTELGAKVADAGEECGEFLCAGPATVARRVFVGEMAGRTLAFWCDALVPAICGLLPWPDSAVHLLWVAAAVEPDSRAEKEQADAAAAEESPAVITSAGPEAPKLDLAGMMSPGAAPRSPRSARRLGPGGRPYGLCISP